MITIQSPIVAVYTVGEKEAVEVRPVLAWDESGQPYVLGERSLVLASSLPGFTSVQLPGNELKDEGPRPVPVSTRPERKRIEERR